MSEIWLLSTVLRNRRARVSRISNIDQRVKKGEQLHIQRYQCYQW
jgi:hypothetical protein